MNGKALADVFTNQCTADVHKGRVGKGNVGGQFGGCNGGVAAWIDYNRVVGEYLLITEPAVEGGPVVSSDK